MKHLNLKGIGLKNPKGYMLVEALISIAIFAVGFLAVATLVFGHPQQYQRKSPDAGQHAGQTTAGRA